MTSAADRDPDYGGFTLIEIVVVLAILALAVGLVMPLFGQRGLGAQLMAAAGRVRAAMAEARATAIAEDRAVVFRGDRSGGYWVDGRHRGFDVDSGDLRILTSGNVLIAFFPSGGSSGGRVIVQGPFSRREIAVDAVTGRALALP